MRIKSVIIGLLLYIFFINFSHAQKYKIRVKERHQDLIIEEENDVNGEFLYPLVTNEQDKYEFEVYSFEQKIPYIIIKVSDPQFITSVVAIETDIGQEKIQADSLRNATFKLVPSEGTINGAKYFSKGKFEISFDSIANKTQGTISVYLHGQTDGINLSYRTKDEAITPEPVAVDQLDFQFYVTDDKGSRINPYKSNKRELDSKHIYFNDIREGEKAIRTFNFINNSRDTLELDYYTNIDGNKLRLSGGNMPDPNPLSFDPEFVGAIIDPFSYTTFTLSYKPNTIHPPLEEIPVKVVSKNATSDIKLSLFVHASVAENDNGTILQKWYHNSLKNPKILFWCIISTVVMIIIFLVDYHHIRFLLARPPLKTVQKLIPEPSGRINQETISKLPRKWKNHFLEFGRKQEDADFNENLEEERDDIDGRHKKNLLFLIKTLSDQLGISNESTRYEQLTKAIIQEIQGLKKSLLNEQQRNKNLDKFKEGFYSLNVTTESDIENHRLFVQHLKALDITPYRGVDGLGLERKKASTLDDLANFVGRQKGTSIRLREESDLAQFKTDLKKFIQQGHTQYPAFVQEFTTSLVKAKKSVEQLIASKPVEQSFCYEYLKTVLEGKTGKRGLTAALRICKDQEEGGLLAERLGLKTRAQFEELTPKLFYQKFIAAFMLEINTFAMLFAYSQASALKSRMIEDTIDVGLLEDSFTELSKALEDLKITFLIPRLFEETYEERKHDLGQNSLLPYEFKSEIAELDRLVIYDMNKVGVKTDFGEGDDLQSKPRVIYKS